MCMRTSAIVANLAIEPPDGNEVINPNTWIRVFDKLVSSTGTVSQGNATVSWCISSNSIAVLSLSVPLAAEREAPPSLELGGVGRDDRPLPRAAPGAWWYASLHLASAQILKRGSCTTSRQVRQSPVRPSRKDRTSRVLVCWVARETWNAPSNYCGNRLPSLGAESAG